MQCHLFATVLAITQHGLYVGCKYTVTEIIIIMEHFLLLHSEFCIRRTRTVYLMTIMSVILIVFVLVKHYFY